MNAGVDDSNRSSDAAGNESMSASVSPGQPNSQGKTGCQQGKRSCQPELYHCRNRGQSAGGPGSPATPRMDQGMWLPMVRSHAASQSPTVLLEGACRYIRARNLSGCFPAIGGSAEYSCGEFAAGQGFPQTSCTPTNVSIEKAKAAGVYKGRPASIDPAQVQRLKAEGMGPSQIAKHLGIGRASVYRALEG